MRPSEAITRELSTSGTLGRAGFWVRHCTLVPLALWLTIELQATRLGWLTALLTTVLLASIWGRRLHDRGHSAWWLLAAAIPVLGPLLLFIDCGLRGSAAGGQRFRRAASGHDYLTVQTRSTAPTP